MSQHPYPTTVLELDRETRVEWFRYERANALAREAYYRLRAYGDAVNPCLVCGVGTRKSSQIHTKCESKQEQP